MQTIPAIVLGGTGYVAGELLRILATHPHLDIVGVMSESQAGTRIRDVFPNLQDTIGSLRFGTKADTLALLDGGPVALFSAAPHGVSAALVAEFIEASRRCGCELTAVDVSADFRYPTADAFAAVYGQAHGAPDLLGQFTCALPEHLAAAATPHIGHPGCFATALLLAAVPLVGMELCDGGLFAVGITGSTGSGRAPGPGTHHPERHANLFAYKPLAHRHVPEVRAVCAAATGSTPRLRFVPHSGPFARGIHVTMQAGLESPTNADTLRDRFASFYAESPFVVVRDGTPRVKDVVGSNYCHIGVATDDDSVAVFVVIDNLVKGAAGGAVQWMNRQLGLAETVGLLAPAVAWV